MRTGTEDYFDRGLVCRNGHWVNYRADDYPSDNASYCSECGAEAIDKCDSCQATIRGEHVYPRVPGFAKQGPPAAYCYSCGRPYPWTVARLQAAQDLLDLVGGSDPEHERLKGSLGDLVVDTPKTQVAATRMGFFLQRVAPQAAEAMRQLLVDVASEAAKKVLFQR